MSGYLKEVYMTFEALTSYWFLCVVFHGSSTSVAPDLKKLIYF